MSEIRDLHASPLATACAATAACSGAPAGWPSPPRLQQLRVELFHLAHHRARREALDRRRLAPARPSPPPLGRSARAPARSPRASALGSFGGTSRPGAPALTTSPVPPTSVATTGFCIAIASRIAFDMPSSCDDRTNTSNADSTSGMSLRRPEQMQMPVEAELAHQRLQRRRRARPRRRPPRMHVRDGARARSRHGAQELLDALAHAHARDDADHQRVGRQAEPRLVVGGRQRREALGVDAARNHHHLLQRAAFILVHELAHRLGVGGDAIREAVRQPRARPTRARAARGSRACWSAPPARAAARAASVPTTLARSR